MAIMQFRFTAKLQRNQLNYLRSLANRLLEQLHLIKASKLANSSCAHFIHRKKKKKLLKCKLSQIKFCRHLSTVAVISLAYV